MHTIPIDSLPDNRIRLALMLLRMLRRCHLIAARSDSPFGTAACDLSRLGYARMKCAGDLVCLEVAR